MNAIHAARIADEANPAPARTAAPLRPRRPWAQLLHAVLDLAGAEAELISHAERPWASVTFAGSRHTIALAWQGPAARIHGERFAEALPEHEFAIARHIVADATVTGMLNLTRPDRMEIEIELLLVEDR